jgi:hypothetical protein
MSTFQEAFEKIKEGIQDMSSLEVVTYKGKITIESGGEVPENFGDIIKKAKAEANFKILACTHSALDGDMKVFYDNEITTTQIEAHHKLVESARQSRQAVVDLFKDAITSALKDIKQL